MAEVEAVKTRKRISKKASTPEDDLTRKLNVTLPTNVYIRIANHAVKKKKTRGFVVEEAITAYLAAERAGRLETEGREDDSIE